MPTARPLVSVIVPCFNEEAVLGLQRHGFPWSALLKLAYEDGLSPAEQDPYYQEIAGDWRETLKDKFARLKNEAKEKVKTLNDTLAAKQRQAADRHLSPPYAAG